MATLTRGNFANVAYKYIDVMTDRFKIYRVFVDIFYYSVALYGILLVFT